MEDTVGEDEYMSEIIEGPWRFCGEALAGLSLAKCLIHGRSKNPLKQLLSYGCSLLLFRPLLGL